MERIASDLGLSTGDMTEIALRAAKLSLRNGEASEQAEAAQRAADQQQPDWIKPGR
jgi:hypothetical protein